MTETEVSPSDIFGGTWLQWYGGFSPVQAGVRTYDEEEHEYFDL